jgi:hypothetical protein
LKKPKRGINSGWIRIGRGQEKFGKIGKPRKERGCRRLNMSSMGSKQEMAKVESSCRIS